jgi:hypothetical protein
VADCADSITFAIGAELLAKITGSADLIERRRKLFEGCAASGVMEFLEAVAAFGDSMTPFLFLPVVPARGQTGV